MKWAIPSLFLSLLLVLVSCTERGDSLVGNDSSLMLAKGPKGGGNPGNPGPGGGGSTATIALSGGYSTTDPIVVGFNGKGKEITFNATTENLRTYELNLPPYPGDDFCVGSDEVPDADREAFWNDFVATQNESTDRSFLFTFRLDNKLESNRTEGFYWTDGGTVLRHFKAGTTNALGLDVNATVSQSTGANGKPVYTLSGGALQVRFVSGAIGGGSVTCHNPISFTVAVQ